MAWVHNRVVMTGIGIVAPNAIGHAAFWHSILRGESGVRLITLFDASQYRSRIAGEVKNFDLLNFMQPKSKVRRMARQTQLALAAAALAEKDSGLQRADLGREGPIPVYLGVSSSAIEVIEEGVERMATHGPTRVATHIVEASSPQQAATSLSLEFEFPTTAHTVSSACAAGLEAVGTAAEVIRGGRADIVITGGADAPITKLAFACFDRSGLASCRNDDPEHASRPFDRDCDSGVISEGAVVFVLENCEHALARGARVYLEITGYGSSMDPDGLAPMSGLAPAIQMALANANRRPQDIDYISAHGPGHPVMDRAETDVIKRVFGDHAYRRPVTSVKGNVGNPLAAGGPMQLVASGLSMCAGLIPPIANHEHAAAGCDLDYVAGGAREFPARRILINSHGLGGGNGSMVVEKVEF